MNKKPTQLKIIEGNPGKRPLPTGEPVPKREIPKITVDLDAGAKKIYQKLAPRLVRLGLCTELDGHSLMSLCQTAARMQQIRAAIKSLRGELLCYKHTIDVAGNEYTEIKSNPLTVMERQYSALYRLQAAEFGLSPRGRAGLIVATGGDDEGADLLS